VPHCGGVWNLARLPQVRKYGIGPALRYEPFFTPGFEGARHLHSNHSFTFHCPVMTSILKVIGSRHFCVIFFNNDFSNESENIAYAINLKKLYFDVPNHLK